MHLQCIAAGPVARRCVSTDKAVNPTSVMGASKREAEMVISSMTAEDAGTRFMAVRFGNVIPNCAGPEPLSDEEAAENVEFNKQRATQKYEHDVVPRRVKAASEDEYQRNQEELEEAVLYVQH